MAHWNCEHSMEKVWTFIQEFWETEEGKKYSHRVDKNSCLKVIDGIESMTGIKISLFYVQGLINGYLHSPEGAILHFIHTVSKNPNPTEVFCKHAKTNFNLRLSIEEVEEILIKLGSKKIGTIETLAYKENNKHYPINNRCNSNIKPTKIQPTKIVIEEKKEDDLETQYKKASNRFAYGITNENPGTFLDFKNNLLGRTSSFKENNIEIGNGNGTWKSEWKNIIKNSNNQDN